MAAFILFWACYSTFHSYASNPRLAKAFAVRLHIEHISTAIETFRLDVGQYPTEHQSLFALCEEPSDMKLSEKWNGPYLYKKDENCVPANENCVPLDAWGNAFVYRYPGLHNLMSYDLYSMGEDGKSESGGNDADDISNWNSEDTRIDYYKPKISIREKAIIFVIVYLFIFSTKRIVVYIKKHISGNYQEKSYPNEIITGMMILAFFFITFLKDGFSALNIAVTLVIGFVTGIVGYFKSVDKVRAVVEMAEIATVTILLILIVKSVFEIS